MTAFGFLFTICIVSPFSVEMLFVRVSDRYRSFRDGGTSKNSKAVTRRLTIADRTLDTSRGGSVVGGASTSTSFDRLPRKPVSVRRRQTICPRLDALDIANHVVSSTPPQVPPPPLPSGYSEPTLGWPSTADDQYPTNGSGSGGGMASVVSAAGLVNNQQQHTQQQQQQQQQQHFDEFDDDWSDDSQSQGNGSKIVQAISEVTSEQLTTASRRSVCSVASADAVETQQESCASDSSIRSRKKSTKKNPKFFSVGGGVSVALRVVRSCLMCSHHIFVPYLHNNVVPDAFDEHHRQPSRSVESGLNRGDTTSKKNITRLNKLVKSGTENFVLNLCKLNQPISERFEITLSKNSIQWLATGQAYTCQVASPQKASKLKGLKSFITYQLTPSFSGVQVCRRYKHFDWLHEQLMSKFSVLLIPPLPEKQVSGRYEEEFVEHRMHLLQLWVSYICHHPVLSRCEVWMHFLTCTDEKKWKQGKRKAEKDEYKDGNFFFTVSCPSQHLDFAQTESRVENLARMARSMENAVRAFHAIAQEQAKRMMTTSKRECAKYSGAFHALGHAFELDQDEQSRPLAEALTFTADCYETIGQLYESQPKRHLEPLMDDFFIYRGMLALVPDAVQIHKSANSKVREHQKLADEGKTSLADADLVRSRAEVIDYTILAETSHFRNECVIEFKKMMAQFLHSEIEFYQSVVDKLKEAYQRFI
ncbi:Sorting nexin lst-4 [Trichinella zimbabwensis]|uniref:Sorting nexin lst-4 n=1 Tax=Trichinella zimbabwensis TaxID=268475 RepID=A0A0V1HUC3_9BILA|nr:Sorting nexin lst-4 [Trichinella zimbabwensis]